MIKLRNNGWILLTSFNSMALIATDVTEADIDLHIRTFAYIVNPLSTRKHLVKLFVNILSF